MTLLSLMLMCVWPALGCVVAWLFGRISDIGGPKKISGDSKKTFPDMPHEIDGSKIT
jgi:hypothetical protein